MTPLQHDQAPRLNRIQATSTRVFVPAFAAWPAALRRPAPPATLAQRPTKLTFHLGHSAGTEQITMSPPKSYRPSSNCSSSRRDTTSPYTYVIAQDGKPDPFHSTAGP
jgi:hypothetical protein